MIQRANFQVHRLPSFGFVQGSNDFIWRPTWHGQIYQVFFGDLSSKEAVINIQNFQLWMWQEVLYHMLQVKCLKLSWTITGPRCEAKAATLCSVPSFSITSIRCKSCSNIVACCHFTFSGKDFVFWNFTKRLLPIPATCDAFFSLVTYMKIWAIRDPFK